MRGGATSFAVTFSRFGFTPFRGRARIELFGGGASRYASVRVGATRTITVRFSRALTRRLRSGRSRPPARVRLRTPQRTYVYEPVRVLLQR